MKQKVVLSFTLPEGEKLLDNEGLVQWFGTTVAIARYQGIECELIVDGKVEEVAIAFRPPGPVGKPS